MWRSSSLVFFFLYCSMYKYIAYERKNKLSFRFITSSCISIYLSIVSFLFIHFVARDEQELIALAKFRFIFCFVSMLAQWICPFFFFLSLDCSRRSYVMNFFDCENPDGDVYRHTFTCDAIVSIDLINNFTAGIGSSELIELAWDRWKMHFMLLAQVLFNKVKKANHFVRAYVCVWVSACDLWIYLLSLYGIPFSQKGKSENNSRQKVFCLCFLQFNKKKSPRFIWKNSRKFNFGKQTDFASSTGTTIIALSSFILLQLYFGEPIFLNLPIKHRAALAVCSWCSLIAFDSFKCVQTISQNEWNTMSEKWLQATPSTSLMQTMPMTRRCMQTAEKAREND